tara:strand:+ start:127 stop:405 length:279 start_codon:yes stop_codon:yes gene_type:complete
MVKESKLKPGKVIDPRSRDFERHKGELRVKKEKERKEKYDEFGNKKNTIGNKIADFFNYPNRIAPPKKRKKKAGGGISQRGLGKAFMKGGKV